VDRSNDHKHPRVEGCCGGARGAKGGGSFSS
jgi:hypothetical protein